MPDRVHHHPNLIYSLGTQVVTLVDIPGAAGLILRAGPGTAEDLPHRWSLVVLEVARLDAVRERLGVDYEEGNFFGKPGLLLSASGANLFLLEES